ncbi:MAG TPA: hypothetical protein ENH85_06730 [Candidatus Scalindua sp.]|nr:hypothetical protein [Candidatus Scalindua sp.]
MIEEIERLRDNGWLERLYRKIDTLIIGYNIQKGEVCELVEDCKELKRRLENHISKHKEYEGGGRPVPN